MAATLSIVEQNGPSATPTAVIDPANLNFGSIAQAALDPSAYPITAQTGGASYEKWFRLFLSALGGSTRIDNLKAWISNLGGGYLTGESVACNFVTTGYAAASYPSGGPSESTSAVATTAAPTAAPASANVGIGGTLSGTMTSTGVYSDWMVVQLQVTASTPAGATNQKTFTIQWDEV